MESIEEIGYWQTGKNANELDSKIKWLVDMHYPERSKNLGLPCIA